MPRKYKKNYRKNYRKKSTKSKVKVVKVNYKKLMDKKINTALEVRMQEIAQSQRASLVSRTWLTRPPTGQARDIPPTFGPAGENLSYCPYEDILTTPYISDYIDRIRATDINTPLNIEDPTLPSGSGVNRGMLTAAIHGFRRGNTIKIKAISLDIRIKSDLGMDRFHDTDNNTALSAIQRSYQQTQGRIFLEYKVVQVSVSNVNQSLPDGEDVAVLALKYRNWGYSPVLDVELKEEQRMYKYKTLISGKVNCSPQISFTKVGHDVMPTTGDKDPSVSIVPYFREISQYKKFSIPIKIEYDEADQNGLGKTTTALYFVARSNVQPGQNPLEQAAAPRIAVISKVYYTDE